MAYLRKCIVASLFLLLCGGISAQETDFERPVKTSVDPILVDAVFSDWTHGDRPGCVCAISDDQEVLFERGYGMANLELSVPLRPSSSFYVASVAKPFTAASVALLVERGDLTFDDDVRAFLPQLRNLPDPVTVRQLAQHSSGIRDYFGLLRLAGRHELDYTGNAAVLDLLGRQRTFQFTPGLRHEYSNSNYVLLAELVRQVSGEGLAMFSRREVFLPLSMARTHFEEDHRSVVPERVASYAKSNEGYRRLLKAFDVVGDGGLLSTARDLTAWGRNLLHPSIGGPLAHGAFGERGSTTSGEIFDYGFGHRLGRYRGLDTIGHTGSFKGFRTRLAVVPAQNIVVAVLCNTDEANASRLSEAVLDVVLPPFGESRPEDSPARSSGAGTPVALSQEQLEAWQGSYWNDGDAHSRRIYRRDGSLYYGREGKDSKLVALGPGLFEMPGFGIPITLEFWHDSDGSRRLRMQIASFETVLYKEYDPIDPNVVDLSPIVGRYSSAELNATYLIDLVGGELRLALASGAAAPLRPIMEDLLVARVADVPYALRLLRAERAVVGFTVDSGWIRGLRFARREAR